MRTRSSTHNATETEKAATKALKSRTTQQATTTIRNSTHHATTTSLAATRALNEWYDKLKNNITNQ